jgi:hypothetical protein
MDHGLEALRRIARLWQVDADRVIWSEQGFDWWPGSFKVSVAATPVAEEQEEEDGLAWRLTVRTAVLKHVRMSDPEIRARIALFAALTPTYAMVYPPAELEKEYGTAVDGLLWLQSTAYLRQDNIGWLPEFLARMAILQPIDAQRQAETLAQMLHATLDVSNPGSGASTDHRDEMLTIADAMYLPKGREANRWAGTTEFKECAERFGRNDQCFGTGDPNGLALETPFGDDSSLIRLMASQSHPYYGAALLATLLVPLARSVPELESECAWFNFFEATSWTGTPQFGSWAPKQRGDQWCPAMAFIVPNLLYAPGIATNSALWQLGRARWIKKKFHPDLQDRTMAEILKERWKRAGLPVPH